jgi:hypothetical protein
MKMFSEATCLVTKELTALHMLQHWTFPNLKSRSAFGTAGAGGKCVRLQKELN